MIREHGGKRPFKSVSMAECPQISDEGNKLAEANSGTAI